MLLRTQEFDRRTLLLQRVIRSGNALDHDIGRRELEGLRRIGGELQLAGANQRGGNVLMSDLVIILKGFAIHNHLKVLEAASVIKRNEAEVLHVADGLDPSGNGNRLATQVPSIGIQLGDLDAIHTKPFHAVRMIVSSILF